MDVCNTWRRVSRDLAVVLACDRLSSDEEVELDVGAEDGMLTRVWSKNITMKIITSLNIIHNNKKNKYYFSIR